MRTPFIPALLLLSIACAEEDEKEIVDTGASGDDAGGDADDDEEDGEDEEDTNEIEEDEAPTLDDVLDALPPCEPGSTDGTLDIASGCAGEACSGMTYDELVAVLGEGDCYSLYYESDGWVWSQVSCDWSGISADFEDEDLDEVPDPGSYTWGIGIESPFLGGTEEGLGIDASMSCFIEQLGTPDSLGFAYDAEEKVWLIDSVYYGTAGVSAYDWYDAIGNYQSDGRVDSITLYGSYEGPSVTGR